MKQKLLLLFIVLLAISGIAFWRYEWIVEKDVIYLVKGPTIIADKTWSGGKIIYYQNDETISMILKKDVSQIVEGEFIERISGAQLIKKFFHTVVNSAGQWSNLDSLRKSFLLKIALCVVAVIFLTVILRFLFRSPRKDRREVGLVEKEQAPLRPIPVPEFEENSDENQIILFFLNLYRLQLGAPESAVTEFEALESAMSEKNKVYELRIKQSGECAKRRMSIGPLGEESGSKSKCYYVIFDVHMVIKIPPKPLTDFSVYIDSIRKEGEIVAKLLPRECIIPKVSVILRRVRQFHDEDTLAPEKIEARYIRWLTNRVEAQNYLKIGKTFVFFMDLSKYFFLAHIIDNLHNVADKTNEEIRSYPDLIWDAQGFAGRYGQRNGTICFKMQELFYSCERDLLRHLAQSDTSVIIPSYRIKGWFLSYLSGREIGAEEQDLSAQQMQLINMRMKTILEENAETVQDYREVIRHQIRDVMFTRNKTQMASMIINLLELLTWLGKKMVSMRDLKPDNLLVAGDRSQYPRFLSSPDQFSIGLIDVETAVYFGPGEGEVKQPQLGGTPFYATPSHLLKNEWLREIYGDLKTVLHLQDWQAIVGIIYKVVTGTALFEKSGMLLPAVRVHFQKRLAQKEEIATIAMDVSRMFWRSAEAEFDAKLQESAPKLQSILLKMGENAYEILQEAVTVLNGQIDGAIEMYIDCQQLFPGETNHQNLKRASHAHIVKLQDQFERQAEKQGGEAQNLKKVVKWLAALSRLKHKREELKRYRVRLEETPPNLTVHDVMHIMFNRVLYFMFKPEWNESLVSESIVGPVGDGEMTYEATI